jgi:hypothetical protein
MGPIFTFPVLLKSQAPKFQKPGSMFCALPHGCRTLFCLGLEPLPRHVSLALDSVRWPCILLVVILLRRYVPGF